MAEGKTEILLAAPQASPVDPTILLDTLRARLTVGAELAGIAHGPIRVERTFDRNAVVRISRRESANADAVELTIGLQTFAARLAIGVELAGAGRRRKRESQA